MKVLVVGGAGYLGSIVGDVLETEHICYHFDCIPVDKARSVVGDVSDVKAVAAAVRNMDMVLYMPLGVRPGTLSDVSDASTCFDVHALGFYHFVSEGLRAGVMRFIYVSTLGVFSKIEEKGRDPLTEGNAPDSFFPYGLSKRLGELVGAAAIQRRPELSMLVVRLCLPCHERDWPPRLLKKGSFSRFATGPNDTRRFFRALVHFDRPGLHIIHASGDLTNETLSNARAAEMLGWKPEGN